MKKKTLKPFEGDKVSYSNSIPIEQLFFNRHGVFADTIALRCKPNGVKKFIKKHKDNFLCTEFTSDNEFYNGYIYLKKEDDLYIKIDAYFISEGKTPAYYGITLFFPEKTNKINKIIKYFLSIRFEKETNTGGIHILMEQQSQLYTRRYDISKPEIDFNLNYNKDFKEVDTIIKEKLSEENSKGIALLYGDPGTGKTTYIRHLIHTLKKKVIYVPPNMTNLLSSPGFIKFFLGGPNSILVIEDAENVLSKRVGNSSSQSISNLLNLSDGLLSDCANLQIVATFNTDIKEIDDALLRKGRLIAKYKFKPLEQDRAIKLAEKIGAKLNNKTLLTDIYNSNEKDFTESKPKIGF